MKQVVAILIGVLLLGAGGIGQTRKKYVDRDGGFSFTPPIGFSRVPMRGGEKWILAKFLCDENFRHVEVRDGQRDVLSHRPTLRIMAFPRRAKGLTEEKKTKKTEFGKVTTISRRFSNPYRNYEDYLKRHHQGGGWHISKLEKTKVRNYQATWTEVEVRALTMMPRDLIALVYHLADKDMVVEVDVLPEARTTLATRLKNSLKSASFFKPMKKGPSTEVEVEKSKALNDSKLSPEERAQKMAEFYAKRARERRLKEIEKAQENKPKGWRAFKRKNFVVLTHVGDKYTKHILNQSSYVRKWLDKKFSKLGDGKVYPSLIRIFKGATEANAYLKGSGDSFFFETGEVVCGGQGNMILSDFDRIAQGLLHQYMTEKNPALWSALPEWLRHGMNAYVGSAFPSKKVGLVFRRPSESFRQGIDLCRNGNLPAIRSLMRSEWTEGEDRELAQRQTVAAELFVRYLFEKGKKGKTKNLLKRWMDMSLEVLRQEDGEFWDKINAERQARATPEPLTEEEEEAAFRERKKKAKEWDKYFAKERRKLLERAFTKTFGNWKESDWKKLQKSFVSWIKSGGR